MSIRDLPEATYLALKERAAARPLQGRRSSIEAEARDILIEATRSHHGLGSTLAAVGRRLGGVELPTTRNQEPLEPAKFE